jgi:hypothetical protein
VLRVLDQRIDRVPDRLHARAVREALEESAELAASLVHALIAPKRLVRVFAVVRNCLPVVGVLLDVVEEPLDALLVVLVLLALNDNLCVKVSNNIVDGMSVLLNIPS